MTSPASLSTALDPCLESLSREDRDRRTVDLLTEAADGDPLDRRTALNQAVELNLSLARALASRYQRRGIPYDDLLQVARLGLVKAVHGFRPECASSFAAYAIPTIRGEVRKYFRDAGWTVRPPRRVQELQARVRRAEAELNQVLQRSPSIGEIAACLDEDISSVVEACSVESCFRPSSFDAPIREGSGELFLEPGSHEPAYDRAEMRLVLEAALGCLASRDRQILDLRFVEGLTQEQIGRAVGLSQMQVSRILTRVLAEMRTAIAGGEAA